MSDPSVSDAWIQGIAELVFNKWFALTFLVLFIASEVITATDRERE
jgi:hypothetical protein